jgi:hypothetical protein
MPDPVLIAHTIEGSPDGGPVASAAIDTTGATFLVVVVGDDDGTSVVTDSKGNVWASLTAQVQSGGSVCMHYAIAPSVGTGHTFTATGDFPSIAVMAFDASGVQLDVQTGAKSSSSTSLNTGDVTPSQNGALVITGYSDRLTFGVGARTVDTPFLAQLPDTPIGTSSSGGAFSGEHYAVGASYYVQPSAAAVSATWAASTAFAGGQACVIAAFRVGTDTPIAYEDPCAMQDLKLFATIQTEDETIKVGVSPLRDPAALGGFAEPRLLDVSDMVRVASDPVTGAWTAQTATMRWADTDRVNRGRSQTRTSFRNCKASIYATSTAQRLALGPPRLLFSGLINNDTADEALVFTTEINDLIGNDYSLFSEEKQIPQRELPVTHFPNAPSDAIGRGEPIVGGRVAPLNPLTTEGVLDTIYCGPIVVNGTFNVPDGTTLATLVAALQASADAGTLDNDWGNQLGHGDCVAREHTTIPSDEAGLKAAFGTGDIDALLNQTAVTGGDTLLACMVASHAITEILPGANGDPSVWIDDTQLDAAELGVSWWAPQISGDTTWASTFGADRFTDVLGSDGTTRRYTLVLVDPSSAYGQQLQNGARLHLDCIGMETVGDGTGTAITGYYALYRHVLINFILQSYLTGAWLTVPQFLFTDGTTLLDRVYEISFDVAASIAALSLSGGRIGSFKIGDRTSVRDVIANFNLSGACLLGQDDYQRLFIEVIDTRRTQFLNGHRTLKDKIDFIGPFVVTGRPDWQANWIAYQYARNYYTNTDERGEGGGGIAPVQDTDSQDRDGVLKKTLQLAYVRDDATALNVANYYLALLKDLPRVATYTRRGPCGMEDDVLQGVPITHYNAYGDNGAVDRAFLTLSKKVNKYGIATFQALDVEGLMS